MPTPSGLPTPHLWCFYRTGDQWGWNMQQRGKTAGGCSGESNRRSRRGRCKYEAKTRTGLLGFVARRGKQILLQGRGERWGRPEDAKCEMFYSYKYMHQSSKEFAASPTSCSTHRHKPKVFCIIYVMLYIKNIHHFSKTEDLKTIETSIRPFPWWKAQRSHGRFLCCSYRRALEQISKSEYSKV